MILRRQCSWLPDWPTKCWAVDHQMLGRAWLMKLSTQKLPGPGGQLEVFTLNKIYAWETMLGWWFIWTGRSSCIHVTIFNATNKDITHHGWQAIFLPICIFHIQSCDEFWPSPLYVKQNYFTCYRNRWISLFVLSLENVSLLPNLWLNVAAHCCWRRFCSGQPAIEENSRETVQVTLQGPAMLQLFWWW